MDRRKLLKLSAAGSALGTSIGAGVGTGAHAQQSNSLTLTREDINACERVMGFDLSEREQEQALGLLEEELDGLRALAMLRFGNGEAPALTFDPRLPGAPIRSQVTNGQLLPKPAPLPADSADIAYASALMQAAWIKSGAITSRALTDIYLKRINALGPKLHCFVTVTAQLAREQADAADALLAQGTYLGPLHGLPYGLKDLADTAGITTSWGAEPYRTRVPETDSVVYQRLRSAGAVLLGKTTLGALAYGDVWFGGKTRNPWNTAEGSSGSSAGSGSAVAAGLCSFAIGTETMGSIVSPADRNGCAGLRPTFGRAARTGAMALCWSLDKIGPLTRTIADTLPVLAAITGPDDGDPSCVDLPFGYDLSLSAERARIGYDPAWFDSERAQDSDRAALETLKGAGFELAQVKLPELPYNRLGPILMTEAAAAFEGMTLDNRDDLLRRQDLYAWPNSFRAARFFPAVTLVQLDRLRRQVMQAMEETMTGVDALFHPSYANNLLQIGNYTGRPTAVLRGGYIDRKPRPSGGEKQADLPAFKAPRSISLTGHLYDEARLVMIAAEVERALGIAAQRPPIG